MERLADLVDKIAEFYFLFTGHVLIQGRFVMERRGKRDARSDVGGNQWKGGGWRRSGNSKNNMNVLESQPSTFESGFPYLFHVVAVITVARNRGL